MSNIESQILVVCLQLWNPSNSRKITYSFLAESHYGSGHICSPSSLVSFVPKCKFDPRISLEKLIIFCIEHVSAVNLVSHVFDLLASETI